MDIKTLVEKIRDAIKANAAIAGYCNTNYGRAQTVYIDLDSDNPPDPETEYPIIIMFADSQGRGLKNRYGEMVVEVGYGIKSTEKTTETLEVGETELEATLVTYTGVEKILEFRKTVEDVLFNSATDLGGSWFESADEAIESDHPYYRSIVSYVCKNPDQFDPIIQ